MCGLLCVCIAVSVVMYALVVVKMYMCVDCVGMVMYLMCYVCVAVCVCVVLCIGVWCVCS